MPKHKRGCRPVDSADKPAFARSAPVRKATSAAYAGRTDEEAMLARYESSCESAMARVPARGQRVCRVTPRD